jgi:hypothetical protein
MWREGVAELLASSDPTQLRQGLRLAASNGRIMAGLRDIDTRLAVGSGSAASPEMVSHVHSMLPGAANPFDRFDDMPDQTPDLGARPWRSGGGAEIHSSAHRCAEGPGWLLVRGGNAANFLVDRFRQLP